MTEILSAEDKLAVARITIGRTCPYYGAILWAFQPTPVPDMAKHAPGPMGVDQYLRLYYDPEALASWTPEVVGALLRHEIGHVLRNHAGRKGEREAIKWNLAGDCEINDDLLEEKVPLPDWTVKPSAFKLKDGLFAEEYYDKIPVHTIKVNVASGGCGSIANGEAQAHEKPEKGDGKTPAGASATEQELMRQRVAEDVQAYVKQKGRGSVPGWLERWANERLTAKVDWRRVLAAYIRRAVGDAKGAVDYTYTRPSRRQLPDFVLPALRQPIPRIAVVVDTSGSMSATELSQILAEIAKVLESGGHRQGVTVISVDAAVHTVQQVFKVEQVKLGGGGGTDMRIGISAALALKPTPHAIIVATDGETPWPERAPQVPVIIARTQKTAGYAPAPAWAKVVEIIPDGT